MADKFASEYDLAAMLQQDVDTASATLALELATGAIQAAAGWRILAETVTGYLCTYAGNMTVLPTARLTALTMTDYGLPLIQGDTMLWATNGLVLRKMWQGRVDYPFWGPVVADFTSGYPPDQVPQQVRGVCLNVAARLYDNPSGNLRESVGQATEFKATGAVASFAGPTLTNEEMAALTPFMAEVVAVAT